MQRRSSGRRGAQGTPAAGIVPITGATSASGDAGRVQRAEEAARKAGGTQAGEPGDELRVSGHRGRQRRGAPPPVLVGPSAATRSVTSRVSATITAAKPSGQAPDGRIISWTVGSDTVGEPSWRGGRPGSRRTAARCAGVAPISVTDVG